MSDAADTPRNVSDRVEAALRALLSDEVASLAKQGRGGAACWPAVLLEIAAKQARTCPGVHYPVASLIARILDLRRPVPDERRMEVARFCWNLVEQSRWIGFGRRHRLRRAVKPFVEELLEPLGEDRATEHISMAAGRHLTVQQLLLRLEPHQPFEMQAMAVKVLPDIVNLGLRTAPRVAKERQETLATLGRAVGMVGGTKYFESLAPKMREACEQRMSQLKRRIEKAGRRP